MKKSRKKPPYLLLRCLRCKALHNAWLNWVSVRFREGATDARYQVVGDIKQGHCPLCREPIVGIRRLPVSGSLHTAM